MTGRSTIFTLYPLSLSEIPAVPPTQSITSSLEEYLRFGLYPKVYTTQTEENKKTYLNDLINNYLYKDILSFGSIRKPKKIIDLLALIGLQLGNEVSIQELAQNLALSKTVVEKYLDVLEKIFVLVNLRGFSRNLRKEISKTSKYFFVDLGVRNAIIQNFNPLHLRSDVGPMFENLCIIERIKSLANQKQSANLYFWRTYNQQEIDLVEERAGKLSAFEFKWSEKSSHSTPTAAKTFTATYANSYFRTITPTNLDTFLTR